LFEPETDSEEEVEKLNVHTHTQVGHITAINMISLLLDCVIKQLIICSYFTQTMFQFTILESESSPS